MMKEQEETKEVKSRTSFGAKMAALRKAKGRGKGRKKSKRY